MTENWPCDRFSVDVSEAQRLVAKKFGFEMGVEMERLGSMVSLVQSDYRRLELRFKIDECLDVHEPFENDVERELYRRTVARIIGRRIGWRKKQDLEHGRDAPFAPR